MKKKLFSNFFQKKWLENRTFFLLKNRFLSHSVAAVQLLKMTEEKNFIAFGASATKIQTSRAAGSDFARSSRRTAGTVAFVSA